MLASRLRFKGALMKTHTLLLLLACSACTSSSGGSDDTGKQTVTFPAACPEQACEVGATVSNVDTLATLINFTPAVHNARYSTGCLTASSDIAIDGTITLASTDVAVPSDCTGDCRQEVKFRLRDQPAGVTCHDPEHFFDFTLCGSVTLTSTTVRVRSLIRDVHPGSPNHLPMVEILPACTTPCADDQFACPATNTCWSSARDYCAYCLGGDNETCACWDGDSPQADGSSCSFYVTGDIVEAGTCEAGRCEAN